MKHLFLALLFLFGVSLASAQSNYSTPYTFTTYAGVAGDHDSYDGTGSEARFYYPYGVTVDGNGNVYVADTFNFLIRKITPEGVVTTLAGLAKSQGFSDGPGTEARFAFPMGIAADASGTLYVTDYGNSTIRKISPSGVVSTLAGQAGALGAGDGTGYSARFTTPWGIAVDNKSNNVYVAEAYSNTIRKITPEGVVTTFAGLAGPSGSNDGIGNAARFYYPTGLAVDAKGNVYVADRYNHTIRKITPEGVVTTFAGLAGSSGATDGKGTAARFASPASVALDSQGNLFVAEYGNNTIRKITPAGVVTTMAGLTKAFGATDGTGSLARFHTPQGIAVDTRNNVYVADMFNHTIRMGKPVLTPFITSAAIVVGKVDSPLKYQITATNSPTVFALGGTLPPGLVFSTTKGLISGTPTVGGTYKVSLRATNRTGSGFAHLTITFSKVPQKITFLTVGKLSMASPYTLAAKASSGLAVTYPLVSGPATLSGNQLTFTSPGQVRVICRQKGNAIYAAAPDLTVFLTVDKTSQRIIYPTASFGVVKVGVPVDFGVTSSSGLPITYTIVKGSGVVMGNSVRFTAPGISTITVTQAGDSTYSAASATFNVTVQ